MWRNDMICRHSMAVAARLNVFVDVDDVDDDVVVFFVCSYVGDTGIMVCKHDVTFVGNAMANIYDVLCLSLSFLF